MAMGLSILDYLHGNAEWLTVNAREGSQCMCYYPLHVLEALVKAYYPAANVPIEVSRVRVHDYVKETQFICPTGAIACLYLCVCLFV